MTSSPIDLDFQLRWDCKDLGSAEALRRAPDLMEEVEHASELVGALELRSEEVGFRWEDSLVHLVSAVCVEPVPALLREGHAVASRSTEYGYLRLDVEGPWIRVGGDDLPSGRLPARPLVEAMLGCAGRFLSLLVAIGQDGFDARALREDRRAAGLALASFAPGPASFDLGPIPASAPRREAEGPVWIEGGDALRVRCGTEAFELPGPASGWLERLVGLAPRLEAGGHHVLPLGARPGWLRVDAEGEAVRLSGDGLPDLRLPRGPLVGALRAVALA